MNFLLVLSLWFGSKFQISWCTTYSNSLIEQACKASLVLISLDLLVESFRDSEPLQDVYSLIAGSLLLNLWIDTWPGKQNESWAWGIKILKRVPKEGLDSSKPPQNSGAYRQSTLQKFREHRIQNTQIPPVERKNVNLKSSFVIRFAGDSYRRWLALDLPSILPPLLPFHLVLRESRKKESSKIKFSRGCQEKTIQPKTSQSRSTLQLHQFQTSPPFLPLSLPLSPNLDQVLSFPTLSNFFPFKSLTKRRWLEEGPLP